jgi:hypothetical protein
MRGLVILTLLGIAGGAAGQTLVFSGPGAQASPGGGSRSVVFAGGVYFVFFDDGGGVAYATSADGSSFSARQTASGPPLADLGFSVARKNAGTLGLVWGHSDVSGYQLRYREATIAGTTLGFGSPTLVSSSATDLRGYMPALAYSAAGTPFIAAVEYNRPYTGPIGGCASQGVFRAVPYRFNGTGWDVTGYCNNFQRMIDPSSVALAPSGANMILSAVIQVDFSTAILNETSELAEPWHIVPSVDNTISAQLSSVQSVTTPTDVHHVYRNTGGVIAYARQDGTLMNPNDAAVDLTVISPGGANPVLSRPSSAAGCYTTFYVSGSTIRQRRFAGSIANLGAESTLFTTSAPPTNLSAELTAGSAPALVWQVGNEIYFALAPPASVAMPTLTAMPASAPADGSSMVSLAAGTFWDSCGTTVPAGAMVTVATTLGTIASADADPAQPGVQIAADAAGSVSFALRAPTSPGDATVTAALATGAPVASVAVRFTPVTDGGATGGSSGGAGGAGGNPSWTDYGVRGGGCGCIVGGASRDGDLSALLCAALVLLALRFRFTA